MPHSCDPSILFRVNERQCGEGHRAKRGGSSGQASRVIGPTKGGHWASVNERRPWTLVPHSWLWKSIEPDKGGSSSQATRGSPPQLAQWVGGSVPGPERRPSRPHARLVGGGARLRRRALRRLGEGCPERDFVPARLVAGRRRNRAEGRFKGRGAG